MRKPTQQWTAFLFGVIFVIGLLTLAIVFPSPTTFQYAIFRTVLSLAAAGVAAMIPGFISLVVSKWLRAGGALAVFAVVYCYNPAPLVSSTPTQTNDIKGDQNQVVNGNRGAISITNNKSIPKVEEAK